MFDGLLKSKFYSKCKSAIKLTKARIEMIKRKRNSMEKYLKNVIADLLKNGLDDEAYARAEGLLIELNVSACFDFVEQFCGCISSHLSMMNKQSECPEECREAVPSLMFAAARIAGLPELRDLRSIFSGRYGNSLEAYVNQEFVEKLKAMPPTKDMKFQLLEHIAQGSGIQWDSKALVQKLYNPPASEQAWSKDTYDEKHKLPKTRDKPVQKIENRDTENKQHNVWDAAPTRNKEDLPSHGRKEVRDDRYKLHGSENNAVCGGDKHSNLSREKVKNTPSKVVRDSSIDRNGQQNNSNSVRNVPEDKDDDKKPFQNRSIPPPYTIPKAGKTETGLEVPSAGSGGEGMGTTTKFNGPDGKDKNRQEDPVEAKPKPISVRSRSSKPPPGRDIIGSDESLIEGVAKVNSNGMRQEAAKPGLTILNEDGHGQQDEEESKMDRLLMHYSTKQSPYKASKVEAALKPPPPQQAIADAGNTTRNRSKDGPPARATSLPPEPSPSETTKGPARASSFQPDTGHVHPKLPDYDDFVARLAALRGK